MSSALAAADLKRNAAASALELVRDGMTVGLGTGSTAKSFVELLAGRVREGLNIRCIATSEATRQFAEQNGVSVSPFDGIEGLDLAVDGADEIDPSLNLIKGGGGALLREKIVAMASTRFCIIADRSKRVEKLGAFPLPVEVVDFGLAATLKMIEAAASEAGCYGEIKLRQDQFGEPFVTDGGHFIADCAFRAIRDAEALSAVLQIIPGVVEHGLFIGLADDVFIAGPEGVTHLKADEMS